MAGTVKSKLKYLKLWVTDWHKDAQNLINNMPAPPTSRGGGYDLPPPPKPALMSASPKDYEWCSAYFETVAGNTYQTALGVLNVYADPSGNDKATSLPYDGVYELDATNEWFRLLSGLFKSMIRFYPIPHQPKPLPEPPPDETGDDEDKFWTALKGELQVAAQEAVNFVEAHWSGGSMKLPTPGTLSPPSKNACIKLIETSAHQIYMDYCRIANHLPDHFSRTSPFGPRNK
jgi:hypothetical protein